MKKITIGILAHVDAGKTTLTESLLFNGGTIRKLGRVDHGDTFLDYDNQERKRGITIFSKQSSFEYNETKVTIIDTPGHIDFSAEMERSLQILDYAILVISGIDSVQVHSLTIWQLLKQYNIPTFIFINKMDVSKNDVRTIFNDLKHNFSDQCYDFSNLDNSFYENMALIDESYLNYYLEHGNISNDMIIDAISKREIFPCFMGSALKQTGIIEFLDAFTSLVKPRVYSSEFKAKVYKITHDNQGNKLTHIKVTGGSIKVKQVIENDEKVDQIRIYNGNKYELVNQVYAGEVCAIKGFKNIAAGAGLGSEQDNIQPSLESYMDYRIVLPDNCDYHKMVDNLMILMEEDPQLHISINHENNDIRVQIMGEIQIEILKNIILERFDTSVDFDMGSIIYKETITNTVEGVGHFEPLRHYSEVHLLMEPAKSGSGIHFFVDCKEEVLPINYQRLVLTHLQEKEHVGVLTGSSITDMNITLISGRAHLKHSEGGDFREATYRAVRQGLKLANCIVLEPYFNYVLTIPNDCLSRAMHDLELMEASFVITNDEEYVSIQGLAPVSKMQNYQNDVISYSKGKGSLRCMLEGYHPCSNQEAIIKQFNYDSERDIENPTGSVFCKHGSGFNVSWNEVYNYMHIPCIYKPDRKIIKQEENNNRFNSEDEELESIFVKTYGPIKETLHTKSIIKNVEPSMTYKQIPECLLVDGYNIIHAWPELKDLAKDNLDAARVRLIDMMCNYQGYKNCLLILVFDAYKIKGGIGSIENYHNITIVYTKEAQSADMYIERTTNELAKEYNVTVATSDALEQMIVLGQGGKRISSRELYLEMQHLSKEKFAEFKRKNSKGYNYLLEDIKNKKE